MFNLHAYTLAHVVISVVGIAAGLLVAAGMLQGKRLNRWTALFLWTTALTSITGFGFPFDQLLPSHIVGALSLIALAVAGVARYGRRLAGAWRLAYVVTAMIALYFNVFVLIVQLFRRVPALQDLAPTQSEPPFAIAQLCVLALFIALTVAAALRFHPQPEFKVVAL